MQRLAESQEERINMFRIVLIIAILLISFVLSKEISQQRKLTQEISQSRISKEILEKSTKSEGIFNVYKYKNTYYLEIPIEKFDREYFVSLQVSKGVSIYPFLGGLTLPPFEREYTECVYFSSREIKQKQNIKEGEQISVGFFVKNLRYLPSLDNASQKLREKSFSDNLILKIQGTYINNKVYIDLNSFVSDLKLFFLTPTYSKFYPEKITYNELEDVKTYQKNMILYISYLISFSSYYNYLNLMHNNQFIVALNIFEYKNDSYIPREADERVGYFITSYADVSSTEGKDGYRTVKKYIYRWDLQKRDKLIIWIENTWPEEYRDTVKEAILEWNKAFNRIGYNDPIEVRVQPDDADWEPEDIRYPTVRYQDSNVNVFAIGPSIALPTTGEIVDADIVFYAPMLRIIKSRFDYQYDVVIPNAIKYQINPLYRFCYQLNVNKDSLNLSEIYRQFLYSLDNDFPHDRVCTYAMEKMEHAVLGALSIMLSDPKYYEINKEKFARDYIKDIVIHEMGHILGLRHNFKASSFVSIEQLQDEDYTSKHGICHSCMDYIPVNIHYKNGKPYFTKDIFMTTIGEYDYLAIEYGYTKDDKSLKQIASKCSIYYGTDEDIFAMDPNIRRFDLSSEGYLWYNNLANVYKYIIQNAPYKLSKAGNNPKLVYWSTSRALNAYIESKLENLAYYLGGKHIARAFFGDTDKPLVKNIDSKFREHVSSIIINDLLSHKPIVDKDSLHNSIIFGSYKWGNTGTYTKTLLDTAYYYERIYRILGMLVLITPLATKYEYYFDEDIVRKNLRKLYFSMFGDIKFNQNISQIRQQTIEDFIMILVYIKGASKLNRDSDIWALNLLYLPGVRNEAYDILEKIEQKLESIKNSPLSTKENKIFAKRMLDFIDFYQED